MPVALSSESSERMTASPSLIGSGEYPRLWRCALNIVSLETADSPLSMGSPGMLKIAFVPFCSDCLISLLSNDLITLMPSFF